MKKKFSGTAPAGTELLCPHCGAVAFRLRLDVHATDALRAEPIEHADGRPAKDGDPIECPACRVMMGINDFDVVA